MTLTTPRWASGLLARDPAAAVLWTPWQQAGVFNSLHQLERKGGLLPGMPNG